MVGEKLTHFHCRGDNMCRKWCTVVVFGIEGPAFLLLFFCLFIEFLCHPSSLKGNSGCCSIAVQVRCLEL